MKYIAIFLVLSFPTAKLLAQSPLSGQSQNPNTFPIYCTLTENGRAGYGELVKFLPDSVTKNLFIDPRKDHNIRKLSSALLWMTLHGWKVVNITCNVGGTSTTGPLSEFVYLLTRDITLDEAARKAMLVKLEENK